MINFSLITPTYNRINELSRLYMSLEKQSYKNFEWIVIDDGSNDNTKKLIKRFQKKSNFNIIYHYHQNKGKSYSINKSFQYIKNNFVGIIDSDDELLPNALLILSKIIHKTNNCAVSYIGLCSDFPDSKLPAIKSGLYNWNSIEEKLKVEMWGVHKSENFLKLDFQPHKDEKFYPESILWNDINKERNAFFTNEKLRIYHNTQDSLGKKMYLHIINNPKGYLDYFSIYFKKPGIFNKIKYGLYYLVLKTIIPFIKWV